MKPSCRLISNAFMLGMHDQARETFQKRAREVHFEAGDHLFDAGDDADTFFLICSGRVAEQFADGPRSTVDLGEGDVIGAACLVPPYSRISTAVAQCGVDALAYDGRMARKLCEDDHDFGFALYQRLFSVVVDRLAAASGYRPSLDSVSSDPG